jgi:hypothetical protein
MRLRKSLLSLLTVLWMQACGSGSPAQSQSTSTTGPAETQTRTPLPTRTAFPTPFPTYLQTTPVPEWVTGFADPILAAVVNRKPDFQDDFSRYRGWINILSGMDGYFYAERYDEMLLMRLPELTKESAFYNPRINRTNFVLTLEFRFNHDQPDDTVRFQFDQSPDQSITFDFSNNRNWKFQWGPVEKAHFMAAIYEHFPPERVPLTIIMWGTQCAVYLNNDPLTYSSACRTLPVIQSEKWVASFRLLRDHGPVVVVNVDNLKLWDLDKIPDLPYQNLAP